MIPDRYRIGSPNGLLISSPLRRSVDCSILLADVEVLLAVVAVVVDVHRQPTGLTPARSALTASGHHFGPPRRTVMGSGDGGCRYVPSTASRIVERQAGHLLFG